MALVAPTTDPELGGFTYIKRKPRKSSHKNKSHGKNKNIPANPRPGEPISVKDLTAKYHARDTILQASDFLRDFKKLLNDLVNTQTFPKPGHLKMMGIGTLTHNPSLTQLSFGLELATALSLSLADISTSDPMYTIHDRELLEDLGVQVHSVQAGNVHDTDHVTMIFAPHVPKSVYEATLRQYWSKTQHFVLIGNNLKHYPDIYSDAKLRRESPAILALAEGSELEVVPLPTNFEHNNVFNDLAIMWIKSGSSLPHIDFSKSEIETEKFEVNQDDVESIIGELDGLRVEHD